MFQNVYFIGIMSHLKKRMLVSQYFRIVMLLDFSFLNLILQVKSLLFIDSADKMFPFVYKIDLTIEENPIMKEDTEKTLTSAIATFMRENGSDAHIIFHTDEHLSENPLFNFIMPISNFSGSNAILLMVMVDDTLYLYCYTDGRYFLQAEKELKDFKLKKLGVDDRPSVFLKEQLESKHRKKVTVDLKKISSESFKAFSDTLGEKFTFSHISNERFLDAMPKELLFLDKKPDNELKPIDLESFKVRNCFKMDENEDIRKYYEEILNHLPTVSKIFSEMDEYKKNRKFIEKLREIFDKKMNMEQLMVYPVTFLTFDEKRLILLSFLEENQKILLSDLSDITWLLNLRSTSNNTGHFPIWAIISSDETIVFCDLDIDRQNIDKRPYSEFWEYFDRTMSQNMKQHGSEETDDKNPSQNVQNLENEKYESITVKRRSSFDKGDEHHDSNLQSKGHDNVSIIYVNNQHNAYISQQLGDAKKTTSLLADLKAIKNDIEIMGMLQANIIDGIGLTKLFYYLRSQIRSENKLTEKDIGDLVFEFRKEATKIFLGDSSSILQHSFDPIIGSGHDSAVIHYRPQNKHIQKDVLLLDTGAQYVFGTTDITRTLHFDDMEHNQEFVKYFTIVLRGTLQSSDLIAPKKYFTKLFEDIARIPLFRELEDYAHGTSHGVGHSNTVHEYKSSGNTAQARNIFSLEPGAYFANKFGIRIENCVVSVLKSMDSPDFLTTMQLTFVPLQRNLIKNEMLTDHEKSILNLYNYRIKRFIVPYLDKNEKEWIEKEIIQFQ